MPVTGMAFENVPPAETVPETLVVQSASGKATFVDVSPFFQGHRLCDSGTSWIHPLVGPQPDRATIRAAPSQIDLIFGSISVAQVICASDLRNLVSWPGAKAEPGRDSA